MKEQRKKLEQEEKFDKITEVMDSLYKDYPKRGLAMYMNFLVDRDLKEDENEFAFMSTGNLVGNKNALISALATMMKNGGESTAELKFIFMTVVIGLITESAEEADYFNKLLAEAIKFEEKQELDLKNKNIN